MSTQTLDLSFGRVRVELLDSAKQWLTTYALDGSRIRGTVQIAPEYDEPLVGDYRRDIPNEVEWELLPSAFRVAYGRSSYSRSAASGTLEVNGSRLADYTIIRFKPHGPAYDFSVRRLLSGIGDYSAPVGARDRTREVVRALLELHRQDEALVHEKAAAWADDRRSTRLGDIAKEAREIGDLIQTLNSRAADLRTRSDMLTPGIFERLIADKAPAPQ